MKIKVIGEKSIKIQYWQEVIELIFPDAQVDYGVLPLGNAEHSHVDIVIALLGDDEIGLTEVLHQFLGADVPVICIGEQISESRYKEYVAIGIRGFLNGRNISVEKFQNTLQIVNGGGFYIEPRSTKYSTTAFEEPQIANLRRLK